MCNWKCNRERNNINCIPCGPGGPSTVLGKPGGPINVISTKFDKETNLIFQTNKHLPGGPGGPGGPVIQLTYIIWKKSAIVNILKRRIEFANLE